MLNKIIAATETFLAQMPKSMRKKRGQFFTSVETARFMAGMFDVQGLPASVRILDPGAGTGILSAALVERLAHDCPDTAIDLVAYETDPAVLPLLRSNLETIRTESGTRFSYVILEDDYILSQADDFSDTLLAQSNPLKFDLIIGNPPYLRVGRQDAAARAMPKIVHGAPNMYFLFAAMSLFNLRFDAEMVYIIPRSWTSGAYFKSFRKYLLSHGKLLQIHLFITRDAVFRAEEVLQETIIVKIRKTAEEPKQISITSSRSNDDFDKILTFSVPYTSVVNGNDLYVYLPTDEKEMAVIEKIHTYHKTLPEEGLRMKTGIVVDFRQWQDLRKEPGENTLPLFYSQHIRNGRVSHQPSGKEYDWIVDTKPGLIQKNKNYVFIKRFTAKEESRRLQCGVYSPEQFKEYRYIGTQNKINFVDAADGSEMDIHTTYGVFALLNSTLFDMYYRILNGSTQVNSTEINNIPVPPVNLIRQIGKRVMDSADLSTDNCDKIVLEEAYGQN